MAATHRSVTKSSTTSSKGDRNLIGSQSRAKIPIHVDKPFGIGRERRLYSGCCETEKERYGETAIRAASVAVSPSRRLAEGEFLAYERCHAHSVRHRAR